MYYTTQRNENAGDKVTNGEHDSTLGDRTKAAGTFREFVVYNSDQVYPEYILMYSRKYQGVESAFHLEQFHMELPVYWKNCHRDPRKDPFAIHYFVDADTKKFLE